MSDLLDLQDVSTENSRKRFFSEPFINSVSHYARSVETFYHSGADSRNRTSTHHYNNGQRLYNNSLDSNGDVKGLIPLPDWPVALSRWGLFWDFHIYGFSALSLILTVVSAAIYLRFRLRVHGCKIVFNSLIVLAISGIFRAVFLLLDPYGCKGHAPALMIGILTQCVYPMYCVCYGLIQVALIRMSKVDVGHNRLRTLSCLLGCTLTFAFLIVVVETLVFYEHQLKLLMLLDSGYFIVWSTCLAISFICSSFKLTQFITDSSGSHEEENATDNHQNYESQTTGLSAISSAANDTSINDVGMYMSSAEAAVDKTTLSCTEMPTSDAFGADADPSCMSGTFHALDSSLQTSECLSNTRGRPSRSRQKISYQDHVTIAVATDDDDLSTSSTDVEESHIDKVLKRKRRRKRHRHSRALIKSRETSRTPTSPSTYKDVLATDNSCATKQPSPSTCRRDVLGNNCDQEEECDGISGNFSNSGSVTVESHPKTVDAVFSKISYSERKRKMSDSACGSSALPLLSSSHLHHQMKNNKPKGDDDDEKGVGDERQSLHSMAEKDPPTAPSFGLAVNKNHLKNHGSHLTAGSECSQEVITLAESDPSSVSTDKDHARENGCQSNTENIVMCPAPSRMSSSSRQNTRHARSRASSRRSSSSCSENDSISSRKFSEISEPDPAGVLGVRKTKLVLRAVHLTYFLTFLFKFACLLQLYTMFGVYGVLGTIPRPDPWPWLIFQSIFRMTEVSIGLMTATIAFIALSHRHLRSKRRQQLREEQQQQQHQHHEVTGDCIV